MRRLGLALALAAAPALAEGEPPAVIDPPEPGSVSAEAGLAAFARVFEVVSHPRCANCHVDEAGIPMWSGPYYGRDRPHGMNVRAGESRIGAETLPCASCHRTNGSFESAEGAPPHAGVDWRLPPPEMAWFGLGEAEICAQLSDPERNGGRDWLGLAEHLVEDAGHRGFVLWGFGPGGGREAAPHGLQAHVDDVLAWGAAGQPCPE